MRPIARRNVRRVNEASFLLRDQVYDKATQWLEKGKIVGLVGGDHSTPLGLIQAVADIMGPIGVLHIDAHADLREAYEGFDHSHASIIYNVLKLKRIKNIVQVAVRDFSREEESLAERTDRIVCYTDYALAKTLFHGTSWQAICQKIIHSLPEKVYVSFDIDGLSPELCPHTGTPVPGGLSFNQAVHLLETLVGSGRKIVGFDLTEVAPGPDGEWDANVGARMLYKLCNLALL